MPEITLDFETFYGTGYTLTSSTTLEYINDERFQVQGVGIQIGDDEPYYLRGTEDIETHIQELFYPGNEHELAAHNTPFDALILDVIYNVRPKKYRCTLSMFRGLSPQSSHTLKALCEALWPNNPVMRKGEELILFKDKRLEDFTEEDHQTMELYCIGNRAENRWGDVPLTRAAFVELKKYLPESELEIIDDTIRLWIEPVIRLDVERVHEYEKFLKAETDQLVAASGLPRKLLSSRKQFIEYLENELNIEVPMKISATTGKPTPALAKNDIEFQRLRADTPELAPIWEARLNVASTQEYTRARRLIQNAIWDDGWLRVALKYYGAHTGRFSGAEKINQQNFKRNSPLRLALTAPPDCYVYVADLSQIEARVLAWFAEEWALVNDFANGIDIYSKFATRVYGRDIDRKRRLVDANGNYLDEEGNIVDDKDKAFIPDFIEGFVGKTCILGLGYGMGPPKFRTTMAQGAMGGPSVFFTEEQSKDIVYNVYRGTYQNIKNTWDEVQKLIYDMAAGSSYTFRCLELKKNRLILPNGMALNYPRLQWELDDKGRYQFTYWNGKKHTKIYGGLGTENIIQALARIILMWQLQQIKREIPELRFALQVHDELIFIGPKAGADERMAHLLGLMSRTPSWCGDVPVTAEGGYAPEYSK